MEALVGVWLSSIVGAASFSVAGYVLGQRGVVIPLLRLPEGALPAAPAPSTDRPTPVVKEAPPDGIEKLHEDEREEDFETVMTEAASRPITTPFGAVRASSPPSSPPSGRPPGETEALENDLRLARAELEVARGELEEARERIADSFENARAARAAKGELDRQLEAVRRELKQEAVTRAAAEAQVQELADRIAKASEESATLRHKATTLDKQVKQLREALQGRVRALTTSEWHRRREIEEAEDMRAKLRDVYDKLERSTLPPLRTSSQPQQPAVTLDDVARERRTEDSVLRQEIARLAQENRVLRARAFGSGQTKAIPSRGSVPEIDLEMYRAMLSHLGGIDGIRSAVLADEIGSVLVGSGELADAMAAFGAYIRDAAGRTEGLLPLEGLDQVEIRDRTGSVLSSRLIVTAPSELLLVLLGSSEATSAASRSIDDVVRSR